MRLYGNSLASTLWTSWRGEGLQGTDSSTWGTMESLGRGALLTTSRLYFLSPLYCSLLVQGPRHYPATKGSCMHIHILCNIQGELKTDLQNWQFHFSRHHHQLAFWVQLSCLSCENDLTLIPPSVGVPSTFTGTLTTVRLTISWLW